MFDIQTIKKILNELGASPKKTLGQNFLINSTTCQKIVDAGLKFKVENIIEVGPGLGALTEKILESKKNRSLTLIEMDSKFCQFWRSKGADLQIIEGDALKVDWTPLIKETSLLISNLPYQISSSLVIDRSVENSGLTAMVLMFQKEVAQRIASRKNDKNYGLLSVIAQVFWNVETLLEAGPKDFYPPPQIASRVIVFSRKELSPTFLREKFLKFVKAGFAQRRKYLIKNLESLYPKNMLEEGLASLGIVSTARPEDLSPDDFCRLFAAVERL